MSKSKHSFVAYIDESGDTGVKPGSSNWFGLAAFVIKSTDVAHIKRVQESICQRCNIKHIHMKDVKKDDKRLFIAKEIADKIDSKCIVCLTHKTSISNIDKLRIDDHFYEYVSKFLLERITNCCADWKKSDNSISGNGKVKIIFATRRGMNYQSLKKYFNDLMNFPIVYEERGNNPQVRWDLIDIDAIEHKKAEDSSGLQFADVLSYSFYSSINKNQYGMFNLGYCMHFRKRMYAKGERIIFNGVTIIRKNELEKIHIPYQMINIFMSREEKERRRDIQNNKTLNQTSKLGDIARIDKWKKRKRVPGRRYT